MLVSGFCRALRRQINLSSAASLSGKPTDIVETEHGTIHLSPRNHKVDPEQPTAEEPRLEEEEDLTPYGQPKNENGPHERSINRVELLGRVGNEPVIRGSKEKPVTVFSMATSTGWKTPNPGPGDSDWSYRTDWHNVAVFKKGLRELAYKQISKGHRVYITGRIMYGEVTDSAGIRRHTTTIAADDIVFLQRSTK